jgi:hypothetical protein
LHEFTVPELGAKNCQRNEERQALTEIGNGGGELDALLEVEVGATEIIIRNPHPSAVAASESVRDQTLELVVPGCRRQAQQYFRFSSVEEVGQVNREAECVSDLVHWPTKFTQTDVLDSCRFPVAPVLLLRAPLPIPVCRFRIDRPQAPREPGLLVQRIRPARRRG